MGNIHIIPSSQLSLIDMLQYEPSVSYGGSRSQHVLIQMIKRDLQDLLNTRQSVMAEQLTERGYEEQSLLRYGIPDLSQFNPNSTMDANSICQAIETAIVLFEPRLQDVAVTVVENENKLDLTVRLQIMGKLVTQQAVSFISAFNPSEQSFQLQEAAC